MLLFVSQSSRSLTLSRNSWVLLSLGHVHRCFALSLRDQQLGHRSSSERLQRFICKLVAQKLECCLLSQSRNMIGLDDSTWFSQSHPTLSNCSPDHPCSVVRNSLAFVLPRRYLRALVRSDVIFSLLTNSAVASFGSRSV